MHINFPGSDLSRKSNYTLRVTYVLNDNVYKPVLVRVFCIFSYICLDLLANNAIATITPKSINFIPIYEV